VHSVKRTYLGKVTKKICSTAQNKNVMHVKLRRG